MPAPTIALADAVTTYLTVLDDSLSKLSHGQEGRLADLPSWAMTARRVAIGVSEHGAAVVRIAEDASLDADATTTRVISDVADLRELLPPPWTFKGTLAKLAASPFSVFGDMFVVPANQLSPPAFRGRELLGFGGVGGAMECFSVEKAKEEAIQLWNNPSLGLPNSKNFILEAQNIFDRFGSMVRRKAFVERRIHRFIASHASILLPAHRRIYSDHTLHCDGGTRKADLILERQAGMPALLIELESPAHRVRTSSGDWTKETNHAKNQIAEWDEWIQRDPGANASGDMSFLLGKRDRLVVIGRGHEPDDAQRSAFTDTTIWTYDNLLKEAKQLWNNTVAEQRRLLGLPNGKAVF